MKKPLLAIVCSLLLLYGSAQKVHYTLRGRPANDTKSTYVTLNGNRVPLNEQKEFYYRGKLKNPDALFISTEKSGAWRIWCTEGTIDLTLEEYALHPSDTAGRKLLRINRITGPAETEKWQWFIEERNTVTRRFPGIPYEQVMDSLAIHFDPHIEAYIRNHPNTRFSASITEFASTRQQKLRLLALVGNQAGTERTALLQDAAEREKVLAAGNGLDDFKMKTLDKNAFALNQLTARYTLLEFWASWCGPCRAQNPALKKVYAEFHPKGFEIVGISFDESRQDWRQAVEKDGLPWIQVSDLKAWNGALSKKYFIGGIPFNILIDENRKVVATGLYPDALAAKLKALLPQ